MNIIAFLALWGTIVSTIALTWNVIRGLQERRQLKVEAFMGHEVRDEKTKVLAIVITNIGRRPIYAKELVVPFKEKEDDRKGIRIITDKLPKMLKEGEYQEIIDRDFSLLSKNIERAYVVDSSGKKWKISRKDLRGLLKDANKKQQQI